MDLKVIKLACKRFLMEEEGATAVEYALMAALIAGVIFVVVTGLGQGTNSSLKTVCTGLGGTSC